MLNVRPVWKKGVYLAVAGDVSDGVFCAAFFPRDVLGEIWT